MTPRLIELQRQRGRLQERIAQQRVQLGEQVQPLLQAERVGQRGLEMATGAAGQITAHPWSVALIAGAVLLLKPRRIWRGLRLGLWVWRRYRSLRDLIPASWRAAFAAKR